MSAQDSSKNNPYINSTSGPTNRKIFPIPDRSGKTISCGFISRTDDQRCLGIYILGADLSRRYDRSAKPFPKAEHSISPSFAEKTSDHQEVPNCPSWLQFPRNPQDTSIADSCEHVYEGLRTTLNIPESIPRDMQDTLEEWQKAHGGRNKFFFTRGEVSGLKGATWVSPKATRCYTYDVPVINAEHPAPGVRHIHIYDNCDLTNAKSWWEFTLNREWAVSHLNPTDRRNLLPTAEEMGRMLDITKSI